ncbi:MAG: hypothetical protein Q8O67_13270 [Deltaproteobacteria bacterium]|nr:hypothetical protein [Deltaproteobacteria bacterium]
MSRLASILLLLLFAAFIGAPAIAWSWGMSGGGTALQNRALAKKPAMTAAAVWDASFGKQFSDWVWDTIPLRDKALKMDHSIDYFVLGDSPSKDALLGKEGFTWRRERVLAGVRAGGGEPAEMHKALDRIERAFREADIPVHFSISPTKASIYSDYMLDPYRAAYLKIAQPLEDSLRERAKRDPAIIDLWAPMLEEKARLLANAGTLARPELAFLWRKNDDHWNVEAGRIQAREIVKAIDPALWDEAKAPTFDGQFAMQESELSILYFKLNILEPYQGFKESPLVSWSTKNTKVQKSTNPIQTTRSVATEHNVPSPKNVLVIRDSMLSSHSGHPSVTRDGGVQTIAPFFEKTVFMHWETLQQGNRALQPRVRGIDHVVVQVTQGSNYYLVRRASELVDLARMIKEGKGQVDDGKDPPVVTPPKMKKLKPKTPAAPVVPVAP